MEFLEVVGSLFHLPLVAKFLMYNAIDIAICGKKYTMYEISTIIMCFIIVCQEIEINLHMVALRINKSMRSGNPMRIE